MSLSDLIIHLEKERLNAKVSFLLFLIIVCIRVLLEISLIGLGKNSAEHFIHNISYFFFTLLIGVFFISLLAKESKQPKKVFNIALFFYPLLLLPPVLDFFVLKNPHSYQYLSTFEFLENFPTLFFGMKERLFSFIIEGFLMCVLTAIYIFKKTDSLPRTVIAFFLVYALLAISSTPSLYMLPELQATHESHSLFYVSLSFLLFILLFWLENSKKFSALVKNFRPVKMAHFLLLVTFGALLAEKINVVNFFLSLLVVFFIRQFSVILNDIFDKDIDKISNPERPLVKKIFSETEYFELGILFLFLAAVYSVLIKNTLSLFVVAISVFAILLYSVPPFRFRTKIFNTLFVGFGSAMTFLFGYVSQMQTFQIDEKIFSVTLLIFIAISLGDVIKDLKDYEGDRKNNVRNVFTIFGLKKGKKISLYLLFISLLIPLFLFHNFFDFLFFPLAAIFSTLDFRKNEKHERVLLYSFLVFFYCFLRMKFILISY